jgi:hypothetical protein
MKTNEPQKSKLNQFRAVAMPIIKYLAENHNPHVVAIVTNKKAELFDGIKVINTDEFISD